jgi:hypothetical protein
MPSTDGLLQAGTLTLRIRAQKARARHAHLPDTIELPVRAATFVPSVSSPASDSEYRLTGRRHQALHGRRTDRLVALKSTQTRHHAIGQAIGEIVEHRIIRHQSQRLLMVIGPGPLRTICTPALQLDQGAIRSRVRHLPISWEEIRACVLRCVTPCGGATRRARPAPPPAGFRRGRNGPRALRQSR